MPMPTNMNLDNIDPQLLVEGAINMNAGVATAPPAGNILARI